MTEPRIAEAEVCDSRACQTGHLLVRGDHISFVSLEQARRVGEHKLDPARMPSDIRMPSGYVLVHDAAGTLLSKCDLYVLKWRKTRLRGKRNTSEIGASALRAAQDYYGNSALIHYGSVHIPRESWYKLIKVRYIRYSRFGFERPFEHRYDVPVSLHFSRYPLALRLALPEGCVVDTRGFIRP